ncbi:MAG: hypothetical protein AAGA64_09485 [Bacteroidota bacterium]
MLNSLGAYRRVVFSEPREKQGAGIKFWREEILPAGGRRWNNLLAFLDCGMGWREW